jgi:hypothetical protein
LRRIERARRKLAGADDGNPQMLDILNAVLNGGLPAVEAACPRSLLQRGRPRHHLEIETRNGRQGRIAGHLTPWTLSSPTNLAICRTLNPAASPCSTSSAGSTSERPSTSSPPTSRSVNGQRVRRRQDDSTALLTCVYRKPKPGRSGGEVHQVSRVN